MSKILITGGAGFIGSNIVEYYINNTSNEIIVVDNLSTGKKENLKGLFNKIEFYQKSILDLNFLKKIMKNVDYVLHHAAMPSVAKSVSNPLETNNVNVNGTLNVLIAARDNKVKRVVYASSSSVYGDQKKIKKKENMNPNPLSPYAAQKLIGEYYCKQFYNLYGLETVCLRYFNVFGPRQSHKTEYAAVIPKMLSRMLKNENPIIYGDGKQSRDFTFVEENVKANLKALSENVAGKVYNIGCGKRITINELVEKLNKILGKNLKPKYEPARPGDVKHTLADITLAKKELKFNPQTSFEEGLKKTIEWYKNS